MLFSVVLFGVAWGDLNGPITREECTRLAFVYSVPDGAIHYRFWQRGGGYDRNVFEPRMVLEQIAYMHGNPVRRGLCARPEDWPYSSAADYAGVRVGPLRIDRQSVPTTLPS